MPFVRGQRVLFGRANGEQTLGEVMKVNRKSIKVKTLEARGYGRSSTPGTIWRVHPSLLTLAPGQGGAPSTSPSNPFKSLEGPIPKDIVNDARAEVQRIREAEMLRDANLRRSALAKLTDEEKRVLGLR